MKYFWCILFFLISSPLLAEDTLHFDSVTNIQIESSIELPQSIFLEGKELNRIAAFQDFTHQANINKLWWILLVISVIFVVTYVMNNSYSNRLLKSLSSIHLAQKMARSPNNIGLLSGYIYILLFCGVLAIALKQAISIFYSVETVYYLYFIIFFVFLILEILFIELTGFVLKKKMLIQKVRFNNTTVLFGSLIFILPTAYLMVFSNPLIQSISTYLFIFLLASIFIYREYRTFRFIFIEKKSIGFFHFFLYICTFKITPFILLVKVLINIV